MCTITFIATCTSTCTHTFTIFYCILISRSGSWRECKLRCFGMLCSAFAQSRTNSSVFRLFHRDSTQDGVFVLQDSNEFNLFHKDHKQCSNIRLFFLSCAIARVLGYFADDVIEMFDANGDVITVRDTTASLTHLPAEDSAVRVKVAGVNRSGC